MVKVFNFELFKFMRGFIFMRGFLKLPNLLLCIFKLSLLAELVNAETSGSSRLFSSKI